MSSSRETLFASVPQCDIDVLHKYLPDIFLEDGIDPISPTFQQLPPADDPTFLFSVDSLISGESAALKLIDHLIDQTILDKYQEILGAMDRISDLNHQIDVSTSSIQTAQDCLAQADREICDRAMYFFRQVQKRKNIDRLIAYIQDLHRTSKP
jgi:hypothetical protein